MKPENFDFGGGAQVSVIHPAVLLALLLAAILIVALPRRLVIVPFLSIIFLAPQGQQIYTAGLHWLVLRIVILFALLRMFLERNRGEGKLVPNGLNWIDRAFVVWALYTGLAPILVFGTIAAVPFQAARWLETFGGYFTLRFLIQDVEDVARAGKTFAFLTLILTICMVSERINDSNVFGYLGGAVTYPEVRAGVIRAQASFGHAILAGCFGATLTPLFFWLWKSGRARVLAAVGLACSPAMVYLCGSSTPALAYVGGIGALFLWPIRRWMRPVRWALAMTLVGLQLLMNAPIWFLIARVNVTGHSDAYDRAMLIDTLVRHFQDWWLMGTDQTGSWGYDMFDLSNQFVATAERGGLICLVCFVSLMVLSFGQLGKLRKQIEGDKVQEWLCWSLGAVLFAHILAYFGVNYFDQTSIWWFAFLAMVSAAMAGVRAKNISTPKPEEPEFGAFWGTEGSSRGEAPDFEVLTPA